MWGTPDKPARGMPSLRNILLNVMHRTEQFLNQPRLPAKQSYVAPAEPAEESSNLPFDHYVHAEPTLLWVTRRLSTGPTDVSQDFEHRLIIKLVEPMLASDREDL